MVHPSKPRLALLVGEILLFVLCLLHLPALLGRPAIPFRAVRSGDQTVIHSIIDSRCTGGLLSGDTLLAFDSSSAPAPKALEFLADFSSIGAQHRLSYYPFFFGRVSYNHADTILRSP